MRDGACPTCGKHGALPEWALRFLNRRAEVKQEMFDCIRDKLPMPDKKQIRKWALRLGIDEEPKP